MSRTAQLNHSYSYWVCEKSDGVRVLFFLQTDPNGGSQAVYLVGLYTAFYPHLAIDATQIDRHNTYYEVTGFWFPHPDRPRDSLMDTILDGELVVDVEPTSKKVCTEFFDVQPKPTLWLSPAGNAALLGIRLSCIQQRKCHVTVT